MLDKADTPPTFKTRVKKLTRVDRLIGEGKLTWGVLQFIVMVLVLAIGLIGMNVLTSLKEEPAKRPPFKTVYSVDSVVAKRGTFQPKLLVYGQVQAAETVELRSLVAGQIVQVNPDLKVGARIEKGAQLFQIDPFSFERELASAETNLAETKARIAENKARIKIEESRIRSLKDQFDLAQRDLERIEALKERGTASSKQLEDRTLIVSQRRQALEQSEFNLIAEQSKLAQLEATMQRFDWNKRQAERNLNDTVLKAPLTGIVSQKNVSQGRLISANDIVVSLYEADRLDVRFTLTDERFGRIQTDKIGVVGRNVEVIWSVGNEEFRFPARIDRIGATITSDRGGVEVIAAITSEVSKSSLRPGAFVEVIVPDKEFSEHFRIPETALYDGNKVYIVKDDQLEARNVTVLARDEDHIIVSQGINDGDTVMTTRIAEISEGLRVRTGGN